MTNRHLAYHLGSLAILAGLILTVVSALKLCTTSCSQAHNYRLFGMPFETTGAVYFLLLGICHFFARSAPVAQVLAQGLLAAGLGAEIFFIILQKMQIGSWCIVCLSIAASIGVCAISYFFVNQVEVFMHKWVKKGLLIAMLGVGFTSSFFGISKVDILEAAETEMKQKIKFGNPQSKVEVYVFTDWACPACRTLEPIILAMAPQIMKEARLTFVDTVIHPETLNYAPYDIAFMTNAKPHYLKVRAALGQLSKKVPKPGDQDIVQAVKPLGVSLKELPYEDIAVTMRYFDELASQYKITDTPTVAVVNLQSNKGKKLSGASEITEQNVLNAIKSLR